MNPNYKPTSRDNALVKSVNEELISDGSAPLRVTILTNPRDMSFECINNKTGVIHLVCFMLREYHGFDWHHWVKTRPGNKWMVDWDISVRINLILEYDCYPYPEPSRRCRKFHWKWSHRAQYVLKDIIPSPWKDTEKEAYGHIIDVMQDHLGIWHDDILRPMLDYYWMDIEEEEMPAGGMYDAEGEDSENEASDGGSDDDVPEILDPVDSADAHARHLLAHCDSMLDRVEDIFNVSKIKLDDISLPTGSEDSICSLDSAVGHNDSDDDCIVIGSPRSRPHALFPSDSKVDMSRGMVANEIGAAEIERIFANMEKEARKAAVRSPVEDDRKPAARPSENKAGESDDDSSNMIHLPPYVPEPEDPDASILSVLSSKEGSPPTKKAKVADTPNTDISTEESTVDGATETSYSS